MDLQEAFEAFFNANELTSSDQIDLYFEILYLRLGLVSINMLHLGPVYTVRTKFQNFLRSYVEGVYTMQNGAYERNSLTAYSVGGHNIVLNWMTEITDL